MTDSPQAAVSTPPHASVTRVRLQEIEALVVDALNEPTGKRPPYGDTSGRFDLDTASSILENLEHAPLSQEAEDTLFVELRMACAEVKLLRCAVATVPELLAEVVRLRAECERLRREVET